MSCFIVSDNHISAIVRYANLESLTAGWGGNPPRYAYRPGQEQEACNQLHAANVRSVNARYSEDFPLEGHIYNPEAAKLTHIEVIKAVDCLAYQCDEWEGFEGGEADLILKGIQCHAVRRLPGYDAASWEIT